MREIPPSSFVSGDFLKASALTAVWAIVWPYLTKPLTSTPAPDQSAMVGPYLAIAPIGGAIGLMLSVCLYRLAISEAKDEPVRFSDFLMPLYQPLPALTLGALYGLAHAVLTHGIAYLMRPGDWLAVLGSTWLAILIVTLISPLLVLALPALALSQPMRLALKQGLKLGSSNYFVTLRALVVGTALSHFGALLLLVGLCWTFANQERTMARLYLDLTEPKQE